MTRLMLIGTALALIPALAPAQDEPEFTDHFPVEECRFSSSGGNPFFILQPGRQLYYSNYRCVQAGDCDELQELWITVRGERDIPLLLDRRKHIIRTRVVEEKETADGKLVEISRNFFASCLPNRDVYYFGEDVDIYANGRVVSHDGAWLAGKHGAEPGIIMPASAFLLGSRYYQELAAGVALDRAEHVATDLEVEVPAGQFDDCIEITETTPLEPGAESSKTYCPGVGLVADGDIELVSIFNPRRK